VKSSEFDIYRDLLGEIKMRVRQAQHRATLSANAEMLVMYWDIGRMIAARQKEEGWGAGVIPRLAAGLKNELPEQKGFSERNIGRMIAFYREYPLLPRPVAEIGAQTAPQLIPKPGSLQMAANVTQPKELAYNFNSFPTKNTKITKKNGLVSAAHRDGSPYLLRIPCVKRVGRTVPVSRGFAWFASFDAKKATSQFFSRAPGRGACLQTPQHRATFSANFATARCKNSVQHRGYRGGDDGKLEG